MAKTRQHVNKTPPPRRRLPLWGLLGGMVAVAAVLLVALWAGRGEKNASGTLLEELTAYRGYSHMVSREEYDFFRGLVEETDVAGGQPAPDERVREYIGLVNAKFYLGSRLGLCDPFDYAAMEQERERENTIRAAKMADGQPVYGVTHFTPEGYFQYRDTALDGAIVDHLVAHGDTAMEKEAEAYYNAHQDAFRQLESITYQLEEQGETTTVTAERALLRSLENSDGTLSDFLYSAQPGDTMDYETPAGETRRVTLVETKTVLPPFDEVRASAMGTWLNAEVMEELLATLARNNPVEFAPNI